MLDLEFEWDDKKERENIRTRGISFEDATDVFYDPDRIERRDDDSSDREERWQTIGYSDRLLFVVYTERGDRTRILSARLAEPFERRMYGDSEILPFGWERVNP